MHATHVTDTDVRIIGDAGCFVCLCPTTERDLADGLGRGADLRAAGRPDLARLRQPRGRRPVRGDARGRDARPAAHRRARALAGARRCCAAPTVDGHASLGLDQDGVVILDPASPRTAGAGADEHAAVFAATAADVTEVVLDGEVVFDGDHERVGHDLEVAIGKVWR